MATKRVQLDLNSMEDTHLKCRDFGHAWDDYDADESNPRQVVQILICLRCKSLKRRSIITVGKLRGFVEGKPYTAYVDGYLHKGKGRVMDANERARIRMHRYQLTHTG